MPLCRPRLRQSYRIFPCNALPRDEGSGSRGEEALMTIHWTYAPANHWPAFCLQGEQRWNSPTADNHPVNGRHGSTTGWARCARRATQPRPSRIGGISWGILRSGRGKVPADITGDDIISWLNRGVTANSRRSDVNACTAFFGWACKAGRRSDNPMDLVPTVRRDKQSSHPPRPRPSRRPSIAWTKGFR